jgi:hypothetical protein
MDGFNFVRAGIVSCYQLAEKGSITLPASMLAHLPANSQPGTGLIFLFRWPHRSAFSPPGADSTRGTS